MTELSSGRLFDNFQMPRSVVHGDSEMELFSRDEEPEETEEDRETFYKKESEMSEEECEKTNETCKESQSQQKDSKGGSQSDPDVKPTHSYIALIAMAILSCPNKKMILGDIYQYISDNFPYYRNKDKSWRNSIRHNLSLNECFIKAGRSENGKGNYWAIHPANLEDFTNGDFRRRRARRRVRRSNPLKFGGTVTQSAYIRGLTSLSPHASYLPYRADDFRVYPGLTYIPPTKKSFAIDSIITGSYDSSLLYSPSSLRSYSSVGLHGAGLDYTVSTGSPSSHLLLHSSPGLGSFAPEAGTSSSPGYSSYLNPSAFTAYLAPRAALTRIGSRHESWQETLSKLQEQLRKVNP